MTELRIIANADAAPPVSPVNIWLERYSLNEVAVKVGLSKDDAVILCWIAIPRGILVNNVSALERLGFNCEKMGHVAHRGLG
jgi:hypothetical protein